MRRRKSPSSSRQPRTRAAHLCRGDAAEQQALAYLEQSGLELLAKNFRCRAGELDLVMQLDDKLIVVEIRYRRDTQPLSPLDTVTAAKRRRIVQATRYYLMRHPEYADHAVRFDVVALSGPLPQAKLVWRQAAFDCNDI